MLCGKISNIEYKQKPLLYPDAYRLSFVEPIFQKFLVAIERAYICAKDKQ